MGNILDNLVSEHRVQNIVEGCIFHDQKFMSEDGVCLKCENILSGSVIGVEQ